MTVCKVFDDYMRDFAENYAHWEVVLNNDERIYMDDDRPGVLPNSAWLRLRSYCEEHKLYIKEMTIMFRDNAYSIAPNMDGYFFSKGARGMFGSTRTTQLFFVGTLQDDDLRVSCWKVPEMMKEWTEQRDPYEAGECLIRKKDISPFTEHSDQSCPTNIW